MQQSHIPTREQADASFARFLSDLGHDTTDPLNVTTTPRLSGVQVHETLGHTVARLRAQSPKLPRATKRRIRRRVADIGNRVFDHVLTATVIGITVYVLIPAAFGMLRGSLS